MNPASQPYTTTVLFLIGLVRPLSIPLDPGISGNASGSQTDAKIKNKMHQTIETKITGYRKK